MAKQDNNKSDFDRSAFMRERHRIAKEQREIYKDKFDSNIQPKYFEFLKNETPLEQNVVSYLVSYQVSYRGRDNIVSTPQTFVVYGFRSQESEIYERTMNMVLDSKGKKTKQNFHPNTIEAIENSTNISIKPRGMEEVEENQKVEHEKIKQFATNGIYVEGLDNELEIRNRKGNKGKLDLDLSHFFK